MTTKRAKTSIAVMLDHSATTNIGGGGVISANVIGGGLCEGEKEKERIFERKSMHGER
jgi:hypothetical protein